MPPRYRNEHIFRARVPAGVLIHRLPISLSFSMSLNPWWDSNGGPSSAWYYGSGDISGSNCPAAPGLPAGYCSNAFTIYGTVDDPTTAATPSPTPSPCSAAAAPSSARSSAAALAHPHKAQQGVQSRSPHLRRITREPQRQTRKTCPRLHRSRRYRHRGRADSTGLHRRTHH